MVGRTWHAPPVIALAVFVATASATAATTDGGPDGALEAPPLELQAPGPEPKKPGDPVDPKDPAGCECSAGRSSAPGGWLSACVFFAIGLGRRRGAGLFRVRHSGMSVDTSKR